MIQEHQASLFPGQSYHTPTGPIDPNDQVLVINRAFFQDPQKTKLKCTSFTSKHSLSDKISSFSNSRLGCGNCRIWVTARTCQAIFFMVAVVIALAGAVYGSIILTQTLNSSNSTIGMEMSDFFENWGSDVNEVDLTDDNSATNPPNLFTDYEDNHMTSLVNGAENNDISNSNIFDNQNNSNLQADYTDVPEDVPEENQHGSDNFAHPTVPGYPQYDKTTSKPMTKPPKKPVKKPANSGKKGKKKGKKGKQGKKPVQPEKEPADYNNLADILGEEIFEFSGYDSTPNPKDPNTIVANFFSNGGGSRKTGSAMPKPSFGQEPEESVKTPPKIETPREPIKLAKEVEEVLKATGQLKKDPLQERIQQLIDQAKAQNENRSLGQPKQAGRIIPSPSKLSVRNAKRGKSGKGYWKKVRTPVKKPIKKPLSAGPMTKTPFVKAEAEPPPKESPQVDDQMFERWGWAENAEIVKSEPAKTNDFVVKTPLSEELKPLWVKSDAANKNYKENAEELEFAESIAERAKKLQTEEVQREYLIHQEERKLWPGLSDEENDDNSPWVKSDPQEEGVKLTKSDHEKLLETFELAKKEVSEALKLSDIKRTAIQRNGQEFQISNSRIPNQPYVKTYSPNVNANVVSKTKPTGLGLISKSSQNIRH